MNVAIPPRSRNHRLPTACDTPTDCAASSLLKPSAIRRQNTRSTSRRCDGLPGDFIGDLPVNSFIHPAGLPITTSSIEVLRRPVESAQYTSMRYTQRLEDLGIAPSVGSVGDAYDNAMAESFVATLKRELVKGRVFASRFEAEIAVVEYLGWFNHTRLHGELGDIPLAEFETLSSSSTVHLSPSRSRVGTN